MAHEGVHDAARRVWHDPPDLPLQMAVYPAGDRMCVLTVVGEIDMLTAPALDERVAEVLREDPRVLVLDLAAVSFMGSHGIVSLMAALEASADRGILLRLAALPTPVRRPLQVTGLLPLFCVHGSVEDAVRDR